jgi:hypothetical protein
MLSDNWPPKDAAVSEKSFRYFLTKNLSAMNLTFEELREIKHKLPSGSVKRIAKELNIDEQEVRNYFSAGLNGKGKVSDVYVEPGPKGGIVHLEDTTILNVARRILSESAS